MLNRHLYCFLAIFFFLFPINLSYAASDEAVNLFADEIIADGQNNTIFASGNVYVTFDGNSLWTDSIFYDKNSSNIYALGKVIFYNQFLASGSYLKYNLERKEGYLSKGEISYLSHDKTKQKFLWGTDIVIKGKETFYLSKGGMSSCDGAKKSWHIEASNIDIELGEYMTAQNATLYALSFPVLFTPYFVAPIKKEKESGFLIPNFGFSGKNGFLFNLPYYLVLDDSRDLTSTLLVKTNNSVGIENQFRYMLSTREQGEMSLSLIDNFDIERLYTRATLKHSKELETTNLKLNFDYVTKSDYFTQYASNSYDKTLSYLRNTGFYEFYKNRNVFSANIFFSKGTTVNITDFRYLTLNKDAYLKQNHNWAGKWDASLSEFSRQGENSLSRIALQPLFLYRYAQNNYAFYTEVSSKVNEYVNTPKQNDMLRGLLKLNVGGFFDKAFLVNDNFKVSNSFKANLLLPYSLTNQDNTPLLDLRDDFDTTKKIKYSYEEKWFKAFGLKELFYLSLSQEYRITKKSGDNSFSDIFFNLHYRPKVVSFDVQGDFDQNKGKLREINVLGSLISAPLKTTFSYYYKEAFEEYVSMDLLYKLGYNFSVILGTRYDISKGVAKETSAGFEYAKSCYSFKTVFTRKQFPNEDIVLFTLNLYGLGEIKQGL